VIESGKKQIAKNNANTTVTRQRIALIIIALFSLDVILLFASVTKMSVNTTTETPNKRKPNI